MAVPYRGIVRSVIKRFKYGGEVGWAPLFGRLLARRLEEAFDPADVDLIVANPTHPSRAVRHTELLLEELVKAAPRGKWSFDTRQRPCLSKGVPTPKSHGGGRAERAVAAAALYEALQVRRPDMVRGRRLLVIDDVVTTGQQLHAVKRKLLEAGAAEASALVLAHPPELQILSPAAASILARLDNISGRSSGVDRSL